MSVQSPPVAWTVLTRRTMQVPPDCASTRNSVSRASASSPPCPLLVVREAVRRVPAGHDARVGHAGAHVEPDLATDTPLDLGRDEPRLGPRPVAIACQTCSGVPGTSMLFSRRDFVGSGSPRMGWAATTNRCGPAAVVVVVGDQAGDGLGELSANAARASGDAN